MLAYREKDNFIYRLHPFTAVAYISVVVLLSLIFTHPVYLVGLFLITAGVIIASGNIGEWKPYLLLSMGLVVVIMLVNAVVVQAGTTVLVTGPRIPVLGTIKITLEAICFSATMGIRLLVIVSAFCFYTCAVHPDRILKLLSRFGSKSVLAIILSTRLFPLLVSDVRRISDVQRCRGLKLDTGNVWQRLRNRLPIINILLLSSLERSMQISESMQARGYGSGQRSFYYRELWRPGDYFVLLSAIVSLVLGVGAALKGWSAYIFYPRLEVIDPYELIMVPIIMLVMFVPVILNWGWEKWPLLKSRI